MKSIGKRDMRCVPRNGVLLMTVLVLASPRAGFALECKETKAVGE